MEPTPITTEPAPILAPPIEIPTSPPPAPIDRCEKARQRRLRSHAERRWRVLTDAEIEAL